MHGKKNVVKKYAGTQVLMKIISRDTLTLILNLVLYG